jgi:hypothetical protein
VGREGIGMRAGRGHVGRGVRELAAAAEPMSGGRRGRGGQEDAAAARRVTGWDRYSSKAGSGRRAGGCWAVGTRELGFRVSGEAQTLTLVGGLGLSRKRTSVRVAETGMPAPAQVPECLANFK